MSLFYDLDNTVLLDKVYANSAYSANYVPQADFLTLDNHQVLDDYSGLLDVSEVSMNLEDMIGQATGLDSSSPQVVKEEPYEIDDLMLPTCTVDFDAASCSTNQTVDMLPTSKTKVTSCSPKKKALDKSSEEYLRRRMKNNIAVKKSREKSKEQSRKMEERVKFLTSNNIELEKRVEQLTSEIQFLYKLLHSSKGVPKEVQLEVSKFMKNFQLYH